MSITYDRRECGNGIALTDICDKKFKTVTVMLRMIVRPDTVKEALYSLAVDILATSCRRFPEKEDLSRYLTGLYSSTMSSNYGRIADLYAVSMSASCVCDKFTIGNEPLTEQTVDILLDCLLDPYLEKGAFSKKYFELCRQDMLDDIEANINNKRYYSALLARKIVCEGEPFAVSSYDYKEALLAATPESVTEAYRELLKTACFEVAFCGGECSEDVKQHLIDRLMSVKREPLFPGNYISPSPLKPVTVRVEESAEANQCQLLMSYKTADYNEYPSKLFIAMFGGSPTSKLFSNVREKMSLCYYCDAFIADLKSIIVVNAGLSEDKLEEAEKAITEQLEAMRRGDFTDEEMESAKLMLSEGYLSNYDSKYALYSWYFYQLVRGTCDSPEDKGRKIAEVTREQIIQEAKNYQLDTVFVLKAKNGGEADEV